MTAGGTGCTGGMSSSRSSKTAPLPTACVGDGAGRSSGVLSNQVPGIHFFKRLK